MILSVIPGPPRKEVIMTNAMYSFFDQRHFSEDCCCLSDETSVECPHHNPPITTALESEGYKPPKVMPVEINQSFPRQPALECLLPLIEYRIKILAADDHKFLPGKEGTVRTNTSITRKAGKLSMLLKPAENLPLRCLSEGLISPSFRGSLSVKFENWSSNDIHLSAGSLLAYLVLTPFIE